MDIQITSCTRQEAMQVAFHLDTQWHVWKEDENARFGMILVNKPDFTLWWIDISGQEFQWSRWHQDWKPVTK